MTFFRDIDQCFADKIDDGGLDRQPAVKEGKVLARQYLGEMVVQPA